MVHLPLEKLHKCSPQIGWISRVVPEDGIIIIIITVTFPHFHDILPQGENMAVCSITKITIIMIVIIIINISLWTKSLLVDPLIKGSVH